jgi:cell division protein FtsQ
VEYGWSPRSGSSAAVARERRRRRPPSRTIDPAIVRRLVRWGLTAAGTVLVVALVIPWFGRVARRHPYFAVREVAVRHVGHLEPEAIRTLAGIDVGTNVWDVDPEVAETRLLTNGWIRWAHVRRVLPDRVVVQVREHRPIAILAVADESPGLYYLAANGRIFAPVATGDVRDLPFVTGLTRNDLAGSDAFGPRAVRRALALLRRAARHPAVGTVSELHVDREAGLTLMPVRPALPIEIGWGEYDAKLARLTEVLPLWSGREAELRNVTCVFGDDVDVRTRAVRPAKPGAGGTDARGATSPKRTPAKPSTKTRQGAGKPAVGA